MAMTKKPKVLSAGLVWAACIAIGFSAHHLSEERAYAVEWPAVQLEFDFVSDQLEAELNCDLFDNCLHIEVLNTANCSRNISIDLSLEDEFGRWIGSEELIVPSPAFKGGFVFEIGSNRYENVDTYGLYTVSCSSTLANVLGVV